jgi:tetratricopeptide (TPR) repeat protein
MPTQETQAGFISNWRARIHRRLTPRNRAICGGLLIAGIVALVYAPSRNGGFLLDDDLLLTGNPLIKAEDGLQRIWFTTQSPDYWPVTNTSLWIEWRLWGMNPAGYHATNIALHLFDSLLIWLILRRLAIPGAFLAGLLFAVHPMNVESVAWIAQRKNVLSLLFCLISTYCFLRFKETPIADRRKRSTPVTARWYWLSITAFGLAMLSKGSVAILPGALLLIQRWRNRVVTKRDWIHSIPYFVVALGLTAVNLCFQAKAASGVIRNAGFLERLLGAGSAVWYYLVKSLAPLGLAFVYPQWTIRAGDWRWWLPLLAAIGLTGVLVWQRRSPWGRPLLCAWMFFGLALLPVMGLTDVGFMRYSLVADHYAHIALVGIAAMVAAAISIWMKRYSDLRQLFPVALAASIVCLFAILTLRQSQLYASPIALYRHTIENNPSCWMAHNNLGNALKQVGRVDEAIDEYEAAILAKPDYAEAFNNLGSALIELGRWQEAIDNCQHSVRLHPNDPLAHNNLALALAHADRNAAIRQYEQALRLEPNFAEADSNWGVLLAEMGQPAAAIAHLERAIRHKPDYAPAYSNLGNTLAQTGNLGRACLEFKLAVQLDPRSPEVRNNCGTVLQRAGRITEAIEQYQEAIRLKPDYGQAESNLGGALAQSGKSGAAISHYRAAIKLNPDFAEARYNLGLALTSAGKLNEAADQFRAAARLKPSDIQSHLNVAMVCEKLQQPEESQAAAQTALDLARSTGQSQVAQKIDAWITAHR